MESDMVRDLLLQAVLILITVFMFLHMHDIPRKLYSKLRFMLRNRSEMEAKRHFVRGAQLISQARSPNTRSIAEQAQAEAEKAISLDPKDAAHHILKAVSLNLQGFKTSALESLDTALALPVVKSLSQNEKGDALFKRAELLISMGQRSRTDAAIEDLNLAVKLGVDNKVKAFCLLGECYEAKTMMDEAKSAYEEAVKVEPTSTIARDALDRLGSNSSK